MSLLVKSIPLEAEYEKPTGITPEDIAKLREWLDTQPHLPSEYITDLDLILIYYKCGCSIEISKQELENQYTLRTMFDSFFKERRIDDKMEIFLDTACQKTRPWVLTYLMLSKVSVLDLMLSLIQSKYDEDQREEFATRLAIMLVTFLPTRTKEGYAVFYSRMIDNDVGKFDMGSSIRGILMVLDLWQYEQGTWPGLVLIFDLADLKFGILSKLDMHNIQQFIRYFPDGLLFKLISVNFLNTPSFIDKINSLMSKFLKKEMYDAVVFHTGSGECLDGVIDVDSLPIEAGGKHKTLGEYRVETLLKMRANETYFLEENKKRVKESLRPGRPQAISDIFGSVEGSFKKLQID